MEWKRKKESKWLIVENRKVHCYLCGRKMLKASQRIYDAGSGHYSHAICEKEKQLTGTNERRSAVKKIVAGAGVLGLTAVGVDKFTSFGRMSNSVFSSNAKDQIVSPDLEIVITSQGIILPSLKSDPANPVAGQMWYRSDAGVTAHFDSIQNRVVYSSEINNGSVNVTSKGIVNGLSVLPNDGTGGFGPDTTLGATSVGEIGSPYTQSEGTGEALQYAINNYIIYNSDVGGYWIPEVHLLSGYITISKPIVLNVPYRIMNLTLKGVDAMSPYIGCAFNTTSSDEYPYAININSSDISNISYINIQWEHLQPLVASGYTPYGFANFDFSSVNTDQNTFIGYDLNVSNQGFTSAFNLLGFQQIHMYDFENYGSGNNFNAGLIIFNGGINYSGATYVSGGNILCFGFSATPNGNISYIALFGVSGVNIGTYNADQTFTIGTLFYGYGAGLGSFNRSFQIGPSSGTITINQVIVRGITASGLTSNNVFSGSQGATLNVSVWNIKGVYSDNEYVWTGIPYNTPTLSANPPVSGTVYQNTNPYDIEIDLPVYATTSGTAGYVTIAKGSTDTPTAIGNQYVSGDTSSTATQIIRVKVPAGWYYEFTGSGVTFATATPFAE